VTYPSTHIEVPMFAQRLLRVATGLALLASAGVAAAQTGIITGRVTDTRSAQPVSAARVQAITGSTIAAAGLSREDGSYRLANLAPGTYTVAVSRIGFAPGSATVTVTAGGTATADVQLTEAIRELNPVVTTASRREEKALTAPASVAVVDVQEIQSRPVATVADQLRGVPGVDVAKGGIVQSNVVARGFNNAFSGSMLMLQDYRFAGVPSLRVNVPFLFTGTNEDVERVEVLLGPASALYGPNSANGVMHVITRSPFTSQGTTVTIDGGTRSLFRGSARHSRLLGDKVGIKLSGEFFNAEDWEYQDPGEPTLVRRPIGFGKYAMVPNLRDFDVRRATGEARLDIRPDDDAELVTTFGLSRIQNALELTGANGTAQARGWRYLNLQQRARFGRLFVQAFLNASDAGNKDSTDFRGTYLLRSGQPIVDKSKVWVGQIQHGWRLNDRQDFIYGLDYIKTEPNTGNTINGRNEADDNVREVGGYVQSTSNLTSRFDLVAALRVDQNNRIEGSQVSPRAALIYRPNAENNFRLTYNRAFGTPANFTMFLDLIQVRNVSNSPYNIRAVGNPPKQGWQFNRSCTAGVSAGLCMKSIFMGPQANTFVPATATAALPGLIASQSAALHAAFVPQIQALLISQGVPPAIAAAQAPALATQLVAFLGTLRPTPQQVGTRIAKILPGSPTIDPASLRDIDPLDASYNTTYEVGYKGILGGRTRLAIDIWRQTRGDVGNPADIATPMVYADSTTFAQYVAGALTPALQQQGLPAPVAQAAAGTIGQQLANNFKGVPLGIITFNDERFANPNDVYATYMTVQQEVTITGADLAVDFVASDAWTFGGTVSWVSDLIFEGTTSSNSRPLMLNAPDKKGSVFARYRDVARDWGVDVRARYFSAYPVNSGVYATDVPFPGATGTYTYEPVEGATVLDLGLNWRLPIAGARELMLSVQADNVLDQQYRTFPGTPLIGRMILTRAQFQF
jgi:iron complex outermembrane receptor protein